MDDHRALEICHHDSAESFLLCRSVGTFRELVRSEGASAHKVEKSPAKPSGPDAIELVFARRRRACEKSAQCLFPARELCYVPLALRNRSDRYLDLCGRVMPPE